MLVARWMAERMDAAVSRERPMMSRVRRQSWVEESRVERMSARASRGARTVVEGFWEKCPWRTGPGEGVKSAAADAARSVWKNTSWENSDFLLAGNANGL